MGSFLITNANIVNEGRIISADVYVKGDVIEKIGADLSHLQADMIIDGAGKFLFPGIIDDQVHFREPGHTHKATIYTESKAAVAGGVTSYMEMPNTVPNTLTQELLEDKYNIASQSSLANYSFFMGASNGNIEEVLKTNPENVCGIKIFMGSSTGNMLVDNETTLENIFSSSPMLIATHCEDEQTIQENLKKYKREYGEDIPFELHPLIRSAEACYISSSLAVNLAKKFNARLHVLHISTAKELDLFDNTIPLKDKKITSEACIHHLWFDEADYLSKGSLIKWNPAIKTKSDKNALFDAILEDKIDVIATDHAPHTIEEKSQNYLRAPSGGPLIQHSLLAMLEFYYMGKISLQKICQKMCHNPAVLFRIQKRGYIREGYYADLVLVDLSHPQEVNKANIIAKCGWSPFEGYTFRSSVCQTWVSGHLVYNEGIFDESKKGKRLKFNSQ